MTGAVAGDSRAFDELVSRYRSRVYYLTLSKVRQEEAARDLSQETFIQAYLSLSGIREPDKFGSWVAAIASNVCSSYLRRLREMPLAAETIQDILEKNPASPAGDSASVARDILYSLPNGTRSAAILYFVEEMKMTEVAQFLDIPLSAVKSRIRIARSHIKKEMVDMVRETVKKHEPGEEFNSSIKHRLELARWYRELGELFEVGVPVRTALARLADADYSDSIRNATTELASAVESGSTISDALEKIPALAAMEAVPMMRVGEASGRLAWSVNTLADRIEVEEAKQKLEMSFWCRVMSGMISAHMSLVEALRYTADVTQSKALGQATCELADGIEAGQSAEEVLKKHADVFPPDVRVAIISHSCYLSTILKWAGNEIAGSVCCHVVGTKVAIPFPESEYLQRSAHWAEPVIPLLQNEDPDIRASTADMLGYFKVTSAAEDLLRLLDDPEPKVIKAAIRALVGMGSAPQIRALATGLRAEDPSVRMATIEAISELGQVNEVAEQLAELLADTDERVAHRAVSVMEDAGEVEVLGNQAAKQVESGKNPELRRRAAAVLDKHLFPAPERILLAVLDDKLPEVRYAAARILGHRGDPRAVQVIREAVSARHLSKDYLFLADDLEKGQN